MSAPDLSAHIAAEAAAIADACTRCGRCVEVCPVTPFVDLAEEPAGKIVESVIGALVGGQPMAAASRWIGACNGCGDCIPACPAGVNPRRMAALALARTAGARRETPQLFRKMSRAVRLMAAMQLLPDALRPLLTPPDPRKVDAVFYTGCNALRTPHVLYNSMTLLDAIGLSYAVVGGPSACCGVIHGKWEGDLERGGRMSGRTLDRFEGFAPKQVLNWCPTCDLHLNETIAGFQTVSFDIAHVTAFLAARLEALKTKFTHPVRKRVVLHAHVGYRSVGDDVARLLGAVPGLSLVETVHESGYTCGGSGCGRAPQLQAIEHAQLLDRVAATGADALVTLYHGCHAAFAPSEAAGPHEVLNFTDLLVAALGEVPAPDLQKRYRGLTDWTSVVDEALPYLEANNVRLSREWLLEWLPQVFAHREFTGGLDCFAAPAHRHEEPSV